MGVQNSEPHILQELYRDNKGIVLSVLPTPVDRPGSQQVFGLSSRNLGVDPDIDAANNLATTIEVNIGGWGHSIYLYIYIHGR